MPVGSLRLILPVISAIVAGAMVAAACGGSDDPQPLTEPTPDASTPIEQQAPAVDDQAAADAPQQDDQPDEPAAPAEDDIALEEPEEPTAVGTYTVQTGDNLSSIAVQFNTSVDEIVALNNLANPNALSVGQVLRLPGGDFPEDEETVADTPEEQEQPDDDESSEPPPDEETEATPDPTPSVTGLSPEGIPQPGPDVVTDQLPTQPGQFDTYATTALPWLHGNTEVDEVLEIILAWSMPPIFDGDRLNLVDTDLSGFFSAVIVFTDPGSFGAFSVESNLVIFDPVPGRPDRYQIAYDHNLTRDPDFGSATDIAVLNVVDLTGDGLRDITFSERSCGANTCTTSFHVLVRDGSGYRDAVVAPIDIPTAFGINVASDQTGDGVPDISVMGGTFSTVGAEPQREFAWVFSGAGGFVRQVSRVGVPSEWLVWRLLDANDAFDRQDWSDAVNLYRDVVNDPSLREFAPFAAEADELRALANLRISLALSISGDSVGSQTAAQALSGGAGIVANAGGAYLASLASGAGTVAACSAFNDAFAARTGEWDNFWSNYGFAVPQVLAADLCPF